MRTKTLLLSAAALAAGIFASSAQTNVYSANVVGYVTQSVPPNPVASPTFRFTANALDTGANSVSNLFNILPNNSKIYRWDYANSAFDIIYTRSALGGWTPAGSGGQIINPGEGVMIQMNSGNVNGTNVIYVGTALQGGFTNVLQPGFTAQAVFPPLATAVTNLGLNQALPATPSGSKLYQWDTNNNSFDLIFTRSALGAGWTPSVPQVAPGVGFFIFNAAATNRPWVYNFTVQ